ncbi:uncharacterized protein LOC144598210 [Rhinoraja longicauda]
MSYKVGRVLPARRRSACLRPRVQGARFGRRPASDRCKHVSEGIRLSGRRGLADSPSKPLRRWKVTSWTLAIILSLVIITIAFSQEEKRLPEYHPRSRKILAHDESSSSMESQAMRRNNTEERRESVLAADHYASSTAVIAGGHVEDLQNRHKRSPGRSHRRMKRPRRKRKRLRNKVNLESLSASLNPFLYKSGNHFPDEAQNRHYSRSLMLGMKMSLCSQGLSAVSGFDIGSPKLLDFAMFREQSEAPTA